MKFYIQIHSKLWQVVSWKSKTNTDDIAYYMYSILALPSFLWPIFVGVSFECKRRVDGLTCDIPWGLLGNDDLLLSLG